jgi:ribosome recycling factor
MEGAISRLQTVLNGVSTGRASSQLLDGIRVECYGGQFPINQVALIGVHDRTITVQPFDRENVAAIEQSIRNSSLGLYPNRSKDIIRINVPQLSGDRQEELVRYASGVAEEQRVAIRNIRRDTMKAVAGAGLTEDDLKLVKADVDSLTKRYIALIDEVLAGKIDALRGVDRRWSP